MKKLYLTTVFLFVCSVLFADDFSTPIYKEVVVNGQKVNKWVKIACITEYNPNGYVIHSNSSNGKE